MRRCGAAAEQGHGYMCNYAIVTKWSPWLNTWKRLHCQHKEYKPCCSLSLTLSLSLFSMQWLTVRRPDRSSPTGKIAHDTTVPSAYRWKTPATSAPSSVSTCGEALTCCRLTVVKLLNFPGHNMRLNCFHWLCWVKKDIKAQAQSLPQTLIRFYCGILMSWIVHSDSLRKNNTS